MSDFVVKNANIYTQNKERPWAEAFAVKDGKFACVGTNEEVEEWAAQIGATADEAGRNLRTCKSCSDRNADCAHSRAGQFLRQEQMYHSVQMRWNCTVCIDGVRSGEWRSV